MPPRCSAHPGATVDAELRDALTVLPLALPHALAQRIWRSLPCDARLRCREVCPAWRDALAEPRLWTELDLTATSCCGAPHAHAAASCRRTRWRSAGAPACGVF